MNLHVAFPIVLIKYYFLKYAFGNDFTFTLTIYFRHYFPNRFVLQIDRSSFG